jgi:hypothetical protein
MSSPRLAMIGFLLAAAAACAQPSPAGPAASPRVSTDAHKVPRPRHGTYEITIAFKRIFQDKTRTDKTYTLLATAGESLPAIRDDFRYRTDASCTAPAPACSIEVGTDVDILSFQPRGDSIYVALKISMQTISKDAPDYLPKLPVTGTHQYLVTPTVPIGRRVTVYSAVDACCDRSVEVQLLIKPYDPDQTKSQP